MPIDPETAETLKTAAEVVGILGAIFVAHLRGTKKGINGKEVEVEDIKTQLLNAEKELEEKVERRSNTIRRSEYNSCRTEWKKEIHGMRQESTQANNRIYDKMTNDNNRIHDIITENGNKMGDEFKKIAVQISKIKK